MKYNGSIKRKLIGIIMLVTLLTGLVGYGSFVSWYMGNQHERSMNLAKTVGLVLGQDIAKLTLLNDVSAAADITSQLKSFSTLNKMVLYRLDRKPIFQYNKLDKSFEVKFLPQKADRKAYIENGNLILYLDAKYQDTDLGFVQFEFEIDSIYEVIKRDISVLIITLSVMCVLSYILAVLLAKRFTEPILKLVSFLENIKLVESLNQRVTTQEENEFGYLYDEVNTMLERIESSQKELQIAAVAFETQSGMAITDKDHVILRVNKAFTDITGYTPQEVIGKTPNILKSGMHDDEFYNKMHASLEKNHFWIGEINNRHKDGTIVNEQLTIYEVLDENGEILYYVSSFLDITLQKKVQRELEEKETMLVHQSKMASMGEMLENIAHQWRQPLSVISTSSTGMMLKKEMGIDISDEEEKEHLTSISDTAVYLSNTVEDFRTFFKTDKSHTKFKLQDCFTKTLNIVSSKYKSLNIEVIENFDDIEITTIENELIQVIMNLLNNARDILQTKNDQRRLIFADIHKVDDNAIITIKDNAGGIPDDIIDKVFDSYFTTKEKDGGTGIGLHMSKEMIEKHMNGTLDVKNEHYSYDDVDYKGASFKITLPNT
ncbi:MAG: PAS domain S-box protein [Campylobacterota bacterium]|nr:PAS domain S-box protein [Campylobacterota bacterium]